MTLCSILFLFSCKKDKDDATATDNSYFPMTVGSNWSYKVQGGAATDTFFLKVTPSTLNAGGKTYTIITNQDPRYGPYDINYRKDNGVLYQYYNVEFWWFLDAPGTPTDVEIIVLKENASVGESWTNPTIKGKMGGVDVTITQKVTVLAKGPATSGVVTSNDVIKILIEFTKNGAPWYSEEIWYARGIGEIYHSQKEGNNFLVSNITRYQVS